MGKSYIKTGLKDKKTLDVIKGNPHFLQFTDQKTEKPIERIKLTRPIENVTLSTNEGRALFRKAKKIYSDMNDQAIKDMLEDALLNLTEQYYDKLEAAKVEEGESEQQKRQDEKKRVDEGYKSLNEIESPLLWIASLTDWYAASERMNILYAFIAYCSQVLLQEPISVIAIGEGGTGKTKILETAAAMVPEEYVMNIKSTTEAALFGFCDEDPYQFDGKIVNIGDMGGKTDHEEAEFFKNAMKELQSDGYMARIKQVPHPDGGFVNKKYELFGKPCLTYTNVPGYNYDDQEASRSLFITPGSGKKHRESFLLFDRLNRQKGTDSYELIQNYQEKIPTIENMVRALRERLKTVVIYNPYSTFMEKFLGSSKYLFRDIHKYNGILEVITAINGYNRRIYDINGTQTIFTTKEDISFFLEILEQYHTSIVSNLSPGATEILADLRKHEHTYFDEDAIVKGVTVAKYMEETNTTDAKRSVQRYFRELGDNGFLRELEKKGHNIIWELGRDNYTSEKENVQLSYEDEKVLKYNYGELVFATFEDEGTYGISLKDQHEYVPLPYWGNCMKISTA